MVSQVWGHHLLTGHYPSRNQRVTGAGIAQLVGPQCKPQTGEVPDGILSPAHSPGRRVFGSSIFSEVNFPGVVILLSCGKWTGQRLEMQIMATYLLKNITSRTFGCWIRLKNGIYLGSRLEFIGKNWSFFSVQVSLRLRQSASLSEKRVHASFQTTTIKSKVKEPYL